MLIEVRDSDGGAPWVPAIRDTDLPQFLRLSEAARVLGVSTRTLRTAARRGELPVYKIGHRWLRVRRDEALKWMQEARVVISHVRRP